MKSSGSSSESTVMWFATLLLPNRIFSACGIVAPRIRSVCVSTICKIHLWWYWKLQGKRQKMKSSGCSSGSTIIWFATLLLPLRLFSAYSIGAPPFPSIFISTIAKIHLWWYWKLHDNRHWIKRSGSSSRSTIIWFATLLLPNQIFSAYSIVAHLIRSVFVSTIAKFYLWWYWKLQGKRQRMKSSGCSSGSTIIWFATLLLPLRLFSAYNIGAPPFPSIFISTIAKIHLWWYWKLHDNRHWIKRSGSSSGSTIFWFATLLLPNQIFSAYSIVAHLIRSVFVSTIAKFYLWW
jgi:hypothetical protein